MKEQIERDEQVLAIRRTGRSFAKIAKQLEFESAREAVAAYRRAVRQRPAKEQLAIRAGERKRFDALEKAVRANAELAPDESAKRLAKIERLRSAFG